MIGLRLRMILERRGEHGMGDCCVCPPYYVCIPSARRYNSCIAQKTQCRVLGNHCEGTGCDRPMRVYLTSGESEDRQTTGGPRHNGAARPIASATAVLVFRP